MGLATPGEQLWVRRYNGPGNSGDTAAALGVSPDGSTVFVTGGSAGSTGFSDYATVAYEASTGARLWVRRYNGPGNGSDAALALGVNHDGSTVFVTGFSPGIGTNEDYATVAYDASTGAPLWVRRYAGPGTSHDVPQALGVSPDGSIVFVTGSSGPFDFEDYATVAYNASTGERLWVRRYDGPGNRSDTARAMAVSPDGSTVFVTGSSGELDFQDYATVAYNASTGGRLWARRYKAPEGNGEDSASALGVSPDGSLLFVTGSSQGVGTAFDYATVAYDASTGAPLWARRYNGPPGNASDLAQALGVSPDGSMVFVTGGSVGPGFYATVAYDAFTGEGLWVRRYDGPGTADIAYALGVSPDGSTVVVTGSSGPFDLEDYGTVAYDAVTGSRRWARRYNGPGNASDMAGALGVSPDGSAVFVTGRSTGSTSFGDYATVAYSVT